MVIDYNIVRWVLENYTELSRGEWPDPESEDTTSHRTQISHHAPYENPCMLAGDIVGRVHYCGGDGVLVLMCYGIIGGCRYRPAQLARQFHMEFSAVVRALKRVQWFCTDEEFRKGLKYGEWKRGKYYRRREELVQVGQ